MKNPYQGLRAKLAQVERKLRKNPPQRCDQPTYKFWGALANTRDAAVIRAGLTGLDRDLFDSMTSEGEDDSECPIEARIRTLTMKGPTHEQSEEDHDTTITGGNTNE